MNTTFYFPSCSVLSLYCFEMEGQITDGKYENVNTGWQKWFSSYNIKFGESGYESPYKIYPYTITDFYKNYIDSWGIRMYYYAKYADAIDNFNFIYNIYKNVNLSGWASMFIEYFGKAVESGKTFEETMEFIFNKFDEISKITPSINKIKDYLNVLFNRYIYNKYKNSNYSLDDLKKDLRILAKTFKNKK